MCVRVRVSIMRYIGCDESSVRITCMICLHVLEWRGGGIQGECFFEYERFQMYKLIKKVVAIDVLYDSERVGVTAPDPETETKSPFIDAMVYFLLHGSRTFPFFMTWCENTLTFDYQWPLRKHVCLWQVIFLGGTILNVGKEERGFHL